MATRQHRFVSARKTQLSPKKNNQQPFYEVFEKHVFKIGIPQKVTSDNGSQYDNKEFIKFAKSWKLQKVGRELEKIIEYKTKGAILRSKCRWHNEGEKNTKYFLKQCNHSTQGE